MEDWGLEGWKDGRVEEWKIGVRSSRFRVRGSSGTAGWRHMRLRFDLTLNSNPFQPFSRSIAPFHPSTLPPSILPSPNSKLSWTQVAFFHDQHRAWRMFHDSFGGATDKQSFDPSATMRTNDNQVNSGSFAINTISSNGYPTRR